MENSRPVVTGPAAFCHVVRRQQGKKKYYVVHTRSPRFVVEMEEARDGADARGVIRRVSLPNSWIGDYHRSARHLGEAMEFFEATSHLRSGEAP